MKLTAGIVLFYGIITALGGITGFIKANSYISLISSVVLGALLIYCSINISKGVFAGVYAALFISFGLGVFFSLRYSKYGTLMPSGLMTILSMLTLGFTVYALSNKEQYMKDSDKENEKQIPNK